MRVPGCQGGGSWKVKGGRRLREAVRGDEGREEEEEEGEEGRREARRVGRRLIPS